MFEDGLRYQDARMASEDEMSVIYMGFISMIHGGYPRAVRFFSGNRTWPMLIRVRYTVLLWEIPDP